MRSDRFRSLCRRAAFALLATALAGSALPADAQTETSKKIGIIGGGNIGGTLAGFWTKAGYEVLIASRHPEQLKPLVESLGPKASSGTPREAAAFGEAVLIAVPYKALPDVGRQVGPLLRGKIVIDAGNAIKARDGEVYDEVERDGVGAVSSKYLAGARIVRAFNAANYKIFLKNSGRPAPRMAVPIAGDDAGALDVAKRLVTDAGFDPVVVGPLESARSFHMGAPGFGHELSAPDLKAKLGLAP